MCHLCDYIVTNVPSLNEVKQFNALHSNIFIIKCHYEQLGSCASKELIEEIKNEMAISSNSTDTRNK